MKIQTVRRVSQIFFLTLFLWFCVVTTLGDKWWQLRGWPVNWLLQLDPLTGLSTVLTTGHVYAGLLWGLAVVISTIFFGRFFCGWICPFGSVHQFFGYVGRKNRKIPEQVNLNRYRSAQKIKYGVLVFALAMAVFGGTLLLGLLDPIPLFQRSVNLVLLPATDHAVKIVTRTPRFYSEAVWIAGVFLTAVFLNFWVPRFYCRFVCPLGAFLGIISRYSIWRIGKRENSACQNCHLCERSCEGACEPTGTIRISECVLCTNCLEDCRHGLMGYRTEASAGGEIAATDLSKRAFTLSLAAGAIGGWALRVTANTGTAWNANRVRPPGALEETLFQKRCINCGQCMRICPTNVIQPAGIDFGLESLWTPVLNFRIGTSGCQFACIACSNVCPTAALTPLSIDRRMGTNEYRAEGPIKIGTAFVDRGRCLPWAMDTPCIVCQENCPVSPKAIFTREHFVEIRNYESISIVRGGGDRIELDPSIRLPARFSNGDYYIAWRRGSESRRHRITGLLENQVVVSPSASPEITRPGSSIGLQIRLQQPYIDPRQCIGCGVCEHECPVKGRRAIRVTAENETRARGHALMLTGK